MTLDRRAVLAGAAAAIATPVAAEGMALSEAGGVLVEADPAAFAAAAVRAYGDDALWGRLSANGLAYAGSVLSLDEWQARLDRMLRRIGL